MEKEEAERYVKRRNENKAAGEPDLTVEKYMEKFNKSLHLEGLPSFRIAYYKPKLTQDYKFKKATENQYIYKREYDETDYSWHYYDFEMSHILLFERHLTKLERYYLREYGTYPIKNLPPKYPQGGQGSQGSGQSSSNGYNPKGYLGIVNERVEKASNCIKTLKSGNKEVIAGYGDFFLMALDCKNFKAGNLYKWDGNVWIELTPLIKYPQECKDAFNDINELPRISQAVFYKEFASFGIAICNGLFSPNIMADNCCVLGEVILQNLPNSDPHKKGALYRRRHGLCISHG